MKKLPAYVREISKTPPRTRVYIFEISLYNFTCHFLIFNCLESKSKWQALAIFSLQMNKRYSATIQSDSCGQLILIRGKFEQNWAHSVIHLAILLRPTPLSYKQCYRTVWWIISQPQSQGVNLQVSVDCMSLILSGPTGEERILARK